MSKQDIENLRVKFAAQREETFRTKLAALMAEMDDIKHTDDFVIDELLMPAFA